MNDNPPPQQDPQTSIPPVGSYQPQAQKPKPKIVGWLIAAAVSCLVLCGICGIGGFYAFNHSGIVINGKELTMGEATKGKLEIKEMSKNTKTGDLSSIDTTIETTSPLSTEFKRCFVEIQNAEKIMDKSNKEFDADAASTMILSSQESRDKAREQYKVQNKTALDYIDTEYKSILSLVALAKKIEPESLAGFERAATRLEGLKNGFQDLISTRNKLMDYLDETPHSYRNGTVEFSADKQVTSYNELSKKYQEAAKQIVALSKS